MPKIERHEFIGRGRSGLIETLVGSEVLNLSILAAAGGLTQLGNYATSKKGRLKVNDLNLKYTSN